MRFVVDTGATSIALTRRDAGRDRHRHERSWPLPGEARTANGVVRTAPVLIDSFGIGEIHDERIMAVVIDGDLDQSLLGMNYLSRYARVSMQGRLLVLER
ncbi:retropepsin-like aspartic protease [Paracoccus sp. DMF-8]|uniref:retropepsin-like aspartic protease family protein n=1 Tax=Paracoccus sp. DMF-8 TaxID=3019445 RepID=UPI0023E84D7B|nr:retropepsin-like aspartic protease [Paracoccus sp. DMF-8]MDF3605913.1 retropepsin-like aspartic protease [Paracoccus sp. DMF-8]